MVPTSALRSHTLVSSVVGFVLPSVADPSCNSLRSALSSSRDGDFWIIEKPPLTSGRRLALPTVMRLAAAKLPVTTEVIDRTTPPRVGFEAVEQVEEAPRIISRGEFDAAVIKQAVAEVEASSVVA